MGRENKAALKKAIELMITERKRKIDYHVQRIQKLDAEIKELQEALSELS